MGQTPPENLQCDVDGGEFGAMYPPVDEFDVYTGSSAHIRCPDCNETPELVGKVAVPDGDNAPLLYSCFTCPNDHYWRVWDRDKGFAALLLLIGAPISLATIPLLFGIFGIFWVIEQAQVKWNGRVYTGFGTHPCWWPEEVEKPDAAH